MKQLYIQLDDADNGGFSCGTARQHDNIIAHFVEDLFLSAQLMGPVEVEKKFVDAARVEKEGDEGARSKPATAT